MQPLPYSAHYAPCAHDLARHEAGAAIFGDFNKLNLSEYLEQILTQVRTTLVPELQKIERMVQESTAKIDKVVEHIDIIERRMHVMEGKMDIFALGKNPEQQIHALVSDAKSTTPPDPNT